MTFFAISMPGAGELALIFLIILVLFGGSKIPEVARNLGKGIREFKKGMNEDDKEEKGKR